MNTKLPENSLILLEGGSLRGLYTAGALDILMEHDLYFPAVAGVSAGALNAYNYVAHQPGRAASINLRYRHDRRYFGPLAAVKGGSLFGLNFLLNDIEKEVPFRGVQLRKHSKAREKRYSFGYAVSFIFACYQILWTFPKSRYLCSRYLPLVCG